MVGYNRIGNIPVSVLVAGISFMLFVVTASVLSRQAKASAQLTTKVSNLQTQLLEAGVAPNTGTSPLKKIEGNLATSNAKTYSGDGLSFKYPASLQLVAKNKQIFLVSDKSLVDAKTIITDKNAIKFTIYELQLSYFQIPTSLNQLTDVRAVIPYAEANYRLLTNNQGLKILSTTNSYGSAISWFMAIAGKADMADGHYVMVQGEPADNQQTADTYNKILASLMLK